VLQLETAMGAAIGVFEGAQAIRVPRTRFAPVKTTNQLLVVRSDAFELADDWTVRPVADPIPVGELDAEHYKLLADFEARFPAGAPSLVRARRLVVRGDVVFGADVVVTGDVEVRAAADEQVHIAGGTALEG
jgi:UTP--glucose-1-phosphate uridylyltransferase